MNGHKNWTHWNVALWLFNDEGLYSAMRESVRRTDTMDEAASDLMDTLTFMSHPVTPDGAKYSKTAIRAALVGWEK